MTQTSRSSMGAQHLGAHRPTLQRKGLQQQCIAGRSVEEQVARMQLRMSSLTTAASWSLLWRKSGRPALGKPVQGSQAISRPVSPSPSSFTGGTFSEASARHEAPWVDQTKRHARKTLCRRPPRNQHELFRGVSETSVGS